ncbi:MAG: 6,7-dimethyl-8-ribityllumazine synthase [Paludibacteraceae bacterium]|nr:6,7-dimethyl-8-ribityllumazine synthase [Paludibacteraceae bacterium]
MATKYHNLSTYNKETMPAKGIVKKQKYAIVVSDWNDNITFRLMDGAIEALNENGVPESNIDIFHVPGSFELTFASKELQNTKKYNAIIALGCVVRGDTPHFDYVCQGVTQGITILNTQKGGCPVIFGVLTTENMQQAEDRCGGVMGNKGVECAITAIKVANLF